ncbi:zonular occludens toxin domain-containing protein [Aerolutibacter daejeonensis]|uniref:zonular occludens toxin domain-containing protein n=1 Tax=Aerolutibacter daejeonensis TaxID=346181 RepID=UPI00068A3466|nr:zonular occludens toxin domain-containing protein [Lysobacter daejeonensis]
MSAIGKTSSITLITAVPGSGKTLRGVWYADKAVKAGELVFASNVNGLNIPGVVDFPDPTKWEELPAGAVLIVDEGQKFWRAGSYELETDEATGKAVKVVPRNIQAMETIRHQGIRLIVITQHPALLHLNLRALVGMHEHLVREGGKQSCKVYRRTGAVIDNVRSHTALEREDSETWVYPKEVFDLYKSAEVHTVERKVKSQFKRAVAMLGVAALLFGFVGWRIYDRLGTAQAGEAQASATARAVEAPSAASAQADNKGDAPVITTAEGYIARYTPLIDGAPWTMPALVNREPLAEPMVACMSSAAGLDANGEFRDASCRCLTEQGTLNITSEQNCRSMARNGPVYNPFKSPTQHQVQGEVGGMRYGVIGERPGGGGSAPTAMAGTAVSSGVAISAGQVNGYGGFGAGTSSSAPR